MCVTSEVWCASVCVRTCDLRCSCAWVCAYVTRVSADPASGGQAEPLSCGPHGRGLTIGATHPPQPQQAETHELQGWGGGPMGELILGALRAFQKFSLLPGFSEPK